MKLLRTIALDPSDTFVFDVAAEPGDWAVSGAFRFCDRDPAKLSGKDRSAFRSGFLGVQSWGWSTLVQIVPATEDDRRTSGGTPCRNNWSNGSARRILQPRALAAEEEVAFAQSLCTHPISALIAVHRSASDGEVREVIPQIAAAARGRRTARRSRSWRCEDDTEPDSDLNLADMSQEPRRR